MNGTKSVFESIRSASVRRLLPMLLMAPLLTACDRGAVVERRMAGDTMVVYNGSMAHSDTLQLEIVQAIGSPDSSSTAFLGTVGALALDRTGDIYVASLDRGVLRFDRSGGYIGLPNEESEARDAIAILPNGSVVGADGAESLPEGLPLRLVKRCAPAPDADRFQFGRYSDLRSRYLPRLVWANLPGGGFVVGCPHDYEFDVYPQNGDPMRVVKDWEPVAVSRFERESFATAWYVAKNLARAEDAGGPGEREIWEWDGREIPDHKPAFQQIIGAEDGRIWVWPSQPSVQHPAPPQWSLVGGPEKLWTEPRTGTFDVFSAEGELIAHAALPGDYSFGPFPGAVTPVISGDTVWAIVIDHTGTQHVARLEPRRSEQP